MPRTDTPRIADVADALRLLTRLPIPADARPARAAAAWAWPVAGLVAGTLAIGLSVAALPLGPGVAAAVLIGAQAMLTGAMHEDGLADCADGFWGGWDRARRLAIMKDSAIGTYGVMALLVVGLVRWSACAGLLAGGHWAAIIGVAALSRAPMAVVMTALPPARASGLSQAVGRPGWRAAGAAVALGVGAAVMLAGPIGLAAVPAACVTTGIVTVAAWVKIGGQTGDVLGASQQLAEAAALSILAAALA